MHPAPAGKWCCISAIGITIHHGYEERTREPESDLFSFIEIGAPGGK